MEWTFLRVADLKEFETEYLCYPLVSDTPWCPMCEKAYTVMNGRGDCISCPLCGYVVYPKNELKKSMDIDNSMRHRRVYGR